MTTTGSGWVVPALVDSFEYLSDGDSATVAIQYSYLPSWISYLVDKSKRRRNEHVGWGRLQAAQAQLHAVDPVIAGLIHRRPDYDPRHRLDGIPPMDLFGALV